MSKYEYYSFEQVDAGISPHKFAEDHYRGYKYRNKSLDRAFIIREAISYTKKNKHAIILQSYDGEYYLFVK
jgi:hypothetical protein